MKSGGRAYMVKAPWVPSKPISVGIGPESCTPVKSLRRPDTLPFNAVSSQAALDPTVVFDVVVGAGQVRGGGWEDAQTVEFGEKTNLRRNGDRR